jgi:2-dehydropantoate 2-reductase
VTPVRSYTVIGMGAIGGYYGGRLAQTGAPVRFVVRRGADRLRHQGLRIESPLGDARLDLEVYDDVEPVPVSDVVVVATKTTATPTVAPTVARLADRAREQGRDMTVVVMQNGLGVESPFARSAPDATVLGAMCFMCANQVAPGHIVHLDRGAVTVGQHVEDPSTVAGVTPAVEDLVADLQAGGVATTPVEDLVLGRWRKLVWNIPFNGLSVVLDAGTDEMLADPLARARARALMDEVVTAAAACGHGFDRSFADRMMADTETMTPYRTSMKLDHDAGRPLELDAIYAAPIAAARAAGAPMVETEALLAELRALDPAGTGDRIDARDGKPISDPPRHGTNPARGT